MPGIYKPTVTNYPNGAISITSMDNTTYEQILASLGSFVYQVTNIYLKTNSINSMDKPLTFEKYDASGNKSKEIVVIAIDPYQYQSSINIESLNKKIFFNGQLQLLIPIEANESCIFIFDVYELSARNYLQPRLLFKNNNYFYDFFKQIDT